MEYNIIENANKILARSNYVINNPKNYKNKWNDLFGNKNPIHLELGMGRGEFIITMAKKNPKINFIGLELNESQAAYAVQKIGNQNIPNLKLICANANDLLEYFGKEIDTISSHLSLISFAISKELIPTLFTPEIFNNFSNSICSNAHCSSVILDTPYLGILTLLDLATEINFPSFVKYPKSAHQLLLNSPTFIYQLFEFGVTKTSKYLFALLPSKLISVVS